MKVWTNSNCIKPSSKPPCLIFQVRLALFEEHDKYCWWCGCMPAWKVTMRNSLLTETNWQKLLDKRFPVIELWSKHLHFKKQMHVWETGLQKMSSSVKQRLACAEVIYSQSLEPNLRNMFGFILRFKTHLDQDTGVVAIFNRHILLHWDNWWFNNFQRLLKGFQWSSKASQSIGQRIKLGIAMWKARAAVKSFNR